MTHPAQDPAPRSSATTPIVPGFHPDPSICRGPDAFYLAHSTFEYSPGVPIWRSEDLVSWELIGHALTRDSQFPAGTVGANLGVYAPTLRFHDGRFWMITTNVVGGDGGQMLVTTDDPRGEWSDPVSIPASPGIDPDIAWDVDGGCYVTWSGTYEGHGAIMQVDVDPATGALLSEPRKLWSGTGMSHPEAPHLIRQGDDWYLLIAEGGTERGHSVSIARADNPRGPFDGCPANPILSHRSTPHPVQNTGHADLVETSEGEWAMVYLAVRPRGTTPGFHVNGRETFLAGVTWEDGWPVVNEGAFTVPAPATSFEDRFEGDRRDLRWISPSARLETFTAPHPQGGLEISPSQTEPLPAFLAARCLDPYWTAQADVDPQAGTAELRVHSDGRHWYAVRASASAVQLVARIGDLETVVTSIERAAGGPLTLRAAAVEATTAGPDDLAFWVIDGGEETSLGRLDGRYLSTEVAGGFTGRVWGVRAIDAPVRVLRMTYDAAGA
ncbi:family 43 glycosylhydrolase [Demequina sp.]|uniref:glycoside hydrolase family 43 protein n=1 Tax=Demequina sp. TaxID=2050685 RepID=UPI003A8598C1